MKHTVWDNVDVMLLPENLGKLTGNTISSVKVKPAESGGFSGSHLSRVETNGGKGPQYVLKNIVPETDWVIRTTNDTLGREIKLWEIGVMDELQTVIDHPIIACAKSKTGWAILMHDISDSLLPMNGSPISASQNQICLEGLASVHARFWQDSSLCKAELGLNDLRSCIAFLTPERCRPLEGMHFMIDAVLDGWERLESVIEPGILAPVMQWLNDPQPLVDALNRYPKTLVHGDFWRANIGIRPSPPPQLIVFDWQIATLAPPAVDLVWWLAPNTGYLGITFDEVIDIYKKALINQLGSAFSEDWWQPQLDLSLAAGFLRVGWAFASRLQDEGFDSIRDDWQYAANWWSDRVRIGLKYL